MILTLIPKVQSPISMKEPRSIRSFRTLYKIVSKMIMRRLRPLLTKLVSPTQASFVPGRHIADNIVVAQEIPKKFREIGRASCRERV